LQKPTRLPFPIAAWMPGLAVFLAVALAFQGFTFGARTSLPEPDDAYTYILKSAQIAEGCALQDCPALNALRAQFAVKSGGEDAEWQRYRMAGRVFLVYHPLYSAALLALGQAGLSWEAGYAALSCLGVLLIGSGIAFFLLTLWGARTASLALLLLAFSVFPGQGLSYIVPSNMALGLGFLALGCALRGWRWWLAAAILAMLLMHPVGKLYSGVALLTAIAVHKDFRPDLGRLLPYLCAALLIGAAFIAPLLIDRPVLRIDAEPIPAGFTLLGGLLANLIKAGKVIASGYGRGPAIGIPLALAMYWLAWRGYRSAPDRVRRQLLIVGMLLAAMCAALLAHVLPHYPAEAFQRAWIALAVLIAGAAAFAMVGPDGILSRPLPARLRSWRDPGALCLGFLAVFGLSGAVTLGQQAMKTRDRHYQTFEPDQVRLLGERCGTALYAEETAALFYLSHGANACPAVYLPALNGETGRLAGLGGLQAPLLLVAAKPGPSEIAIAHRQPAEIAIGRGAAHRLRLRLTPASPPPALSIRMGAAGREQVLDIAPAGGDGVITVDLPPSDDITTVTVAMPSRFAVVYLEGMHADGAAQDWPWNRDITLLHKRRLFGFSAPVLTAGQFSTMEVIDSRGSTLLAKLNAAR
jgi:hypothetical protein